MLVSKNSAVLATWKWLLKEKAATQWLCLIIICVVLPVAFVTRLTCWPFCKIDIMSSPSLLPIPVPPASICLGLVGLQSNHLSHVNLLPNLGANRLFQFDDCFQICLFDHQKIQPKCQGCNFVWLKINLMIVNCPLSWTFKYLRKKKWCCR